MKKLICIFLIGKYFEKIVHDSLDISDDNVKTTFEWLLPGILKNLPFISIIFK